MRDASSRQHQRFQAVTAYSQDDSCRVHPIRIAMRVREATDGADGRVASEA